jgi:hypothetical protein
MKTRRRCSKNLRGWLFRSIEPIIPEGKCRLIFLALVNLVRKLLFIYGKRNKYAIFSAFGLSNQGTINYSKNMMKGQMKQSGGGFLLDQKLVERFHKKGIACAAEHFDESMFKV